MTDVRRQLAKRPDTWLNHVDEDTRYDKKGNPKTLENITRNTREAFGQICAAVTSPLWIPVQTFMLFLNPERPKGGMFKLFGTMVGGAVYSFFAGLKDLLFVNAAHASDAGARALFGSSTKK